MHLKRIELTNYRQHRELDVDFHGNLIAILGVNGSGKSNLIGGIQYALTGEQPGFTKADLTTWGEKEGSVKLVFDAGPKNEEFVIVRKTNGDVTLKVGGETIKQARKVEEALRERAGLDKELIRQIVFVPQKGIDAILFDDPKNREVAFQRLIGIGNASKIYTALGTEISALDKPQGFDEAIERSRQQLEEQRGIAKVCRETLGKYEEALKALPSKEDLEREVDKLAGAQSATDELVSVRERLEKAQAEHEEALKEAGEDPGDLDAREEALRRSERVESDHVRYLTRLKELSDAAMEAKTESDDALGKAEGLLAPYVGCIEAERTITKELEDAQAGLAAEVRSLRNMMKEASSDGTCPLCGAPATQEDIQKHVGDRLGELEGELAKAREKAASARAALDARENAESRAAEMMREAKTRLAAAMSALQKAKDKNVEGVDIDMDTFEVSYMGLSPGDIKACEERLKSAREELASVAATKSRTREARDRVSGLSAQIDLLVQKRSDAAKRLADMGIDPEAVEAGSSERRRAAAAKARANLEAFNGILRDMAGEKGRLQSTEETIEKTQKLIDELVEKKELEDKVREKVDTLKRVREWFDIGPMAA